METTQEKAEKRWYLVNIIDPTDEDHGALFLVKAGNVADAVRKLAVLRSPHIMIVTIATLEETPAELKSITEGKPDATIIKLMEVEDELEY